VDLGLVQTAHDEVQDLYDNAPCGYHSLDKEGHVLRMNQTELNWLGLTAAQVLGRRYEDFMTPDSQRLFRTSFPAFLRDGHISDLAFELVHVSGSTRPVLVSATSLRDANGQFLASRSTVFDHTDKRRFEAQLERLANTDALTLLSNRRDFYQKAQQEIARCGRSGGSFSVLMLDVDHFKAVNDRFGHAAGDEVLRQLARHLQDTLRAVDSAARLGGEEFAVLTPDSPLEGAQWLAERVRQQLEAASVPWVNGGPLRFTVSIGVAQWQPGEDIDATLHRADSALYEAKQTGRNRVCVSP
jgi:diguanylate cyclase (GGDEF)-like protein/PAS domain S-box-containing protein